MRSTNKNNIMSAKELIIKLEDINTKYKLKYKNQIPYYKRIIEELKKIKKTEDIKGVINILKKCEDYCGKSKNSYKGNQVMPILSLFATTKLFLNNQTKDGNLVLDFNLVHTYDLNVLTTTDEDKISFSDTKETTVTTTLTSSKSEIKKSKSLINLTKCNELETNIELFEIMKQKQKNLKEENEKLKNINEKINNFQANFQQEKQVLRKWWHWPLKFITCGLWESKAIKQLNAKYSDDSFNNLNWEFKELEIKIKTLNSEIESLITKLETTCSLTHDNKSHSLSTLNEDNIKPSCVDNFQSSEINNFNETNLSKQTLCSLSPKHL